MTDQHPTTPGPHGSGPHGSGPHGSGPETARPGPLTLRPMTAAELEALVGRTVVDYAADQVRAGRWTGEEAERRAREELDGLLPDGLATPDTLLRTAVDEHGARVGHVWVALRRTPEQAWIYDIEVVAGHRGRGLGRALLAATEVDVAAHGVAELGLNVFGHNAVARALYASAGYEPATMQLRKRFSPP